MHKFRWPSRFFSLAASQRRPSRRPRLLQASPLESRTVPTIYTVDTTADTASGTGATVSLRYCIGQANLSSDADFVNFKGSVFPSGSSTTIELSASLGILPAIEYPLTINGLGASKVAVSSGSKLRVLDIAMKTSTDKVSISSLAITNGLPSSGDGAGVRITSGALTLTSCKLTSNQLSKGNGAGLAVLGGTAYLGNCSVSINNIGADEHGANTYRGAGIFAASGVTLTVDNCKIVANTSNNAGGGIGSSGGNVTIQNGTTFGNDIEGPGGNVFQDGGTLV